MPYIPQPFQQYGGIWNLSSQSQAQGQTTWPVPPYQYHLYAWGQNGSGQLGLGNITNYSSPKQVGSLTNWLTISSGYAYVVSTKNDGTLWSWGNNANGEFGELVRGSWKDVLIFFGV